jgi:hypothetical protein
MRGVRRLVPSWQGVPRAHLQLQETQLPEAFARLSDWAARPAQWQEAGWASRGSPRARAQAPMLLSLQAALMIVPVARF